MTAEHFDVLLVGAGLSGIGAAYHLQAECPGKSFALLEGRDTIGGTWDLFRYPGIRSDSDMFTLGYPFRPWREGKAIADGPAILQYIKDTAAEYGIDKKIRFGHRVVGASWSSADSRWTVDVEQGPERTPCRFTCSFLFLCTGYYDYAEGYTPELPGVERYQGRLVHPQKWTPDVDYAGKRVTVIGSGATAVTLVPELAKSAAHVTMLQRTPTYIVSLPNNDPWAAFAHKWLPARVSYRLVRWKNVMQSMLFYILSRRTPRFVKWVIRRGVRRELGPEADLTHFTPPYDPWDQRLCIVPDADLFKAIRSGQVSVVTDQIESFTETGLKLRSGKEIEADLIITATGLKMLLMGGARLEVDGKPFDPPRSKVYKGMMLSDVPNLAFAMGYTNASWTLKCDLVCRYVCRLLNYMDRKGYQQCRPRAAAHLEEEPLINFTSGYVQRSIAELPRQGSKAPWKLYQNYILDLLTLRLGSVTDSMEFRKAPVATTSRAAATANVP
ncbi:MAG TPA: NAD(P)/FAD-dependent oxidoreductase [Gemmatales bacterium]|nr:NAD(P)/FAD-dependent oxidoreductase [Gemmatales bacterium]HMP57809.1 NAD(P)/FAD-dependent oxidoreductase [Gemmatales bacterium]